MIKKRLRETALLLITLAIACVGLFQMFMRVANEIPNKYVLPFCVLVALICIFWALLTAFQVYASQIIFLCVVLLSLIGITEIIRIDYENVTLGRSATSAGMNQIIWMCIGLALCAFLIVFLKDYRVLRRFSYLSMFFGLLLMFSPLIPGLGKTIGGARIWIGIGSHTIQPAEFAKLFLAFFFAAYLFDHRDQLAVGGKKIGALHLPRLRDFGPIIVVWFACIGLLVMQRDLGTSLMFFAMFVCMLYVSTGRTSWIAIGFVFIAISAFAAAHLFSHVQNRVTAWLHPFSQSVYNAVGGSEQLVTGIFGLSTGGMIGTGLGNGYPALTPLANSDFIYSSLGEELGLTGLFAIMAIYLVIIGAGIIVAIRIKDGFGKLLASGLVFTMAFQVFTVVGGITLVIPLTGLTLPYMAAGGSSLIANTILATLLLIISNQANKPEEDISTDAFNAEALKVIRNAQALKQAQLEQEEQQARAHLGSTHTAAATPEAEETMAIVHNAASVEAPVAATDTTEFIARADTTESPTVEVNIDNARNEDQKQPEQGERDE